MFGMGMTEILVILVVAMLFLGPDKLPDAARSISKGIRDLRRQTREFQETIEEDHDIGGAIRDIQSALRGDEAPRRPPVRKPPPAEATAAAATTAAAALAEAPVTPEATSTDEAAPAAQAPTTDQAGADAATAAAAPATAERPPAEPDGDADPDADADAAPEDDDLARLIRPAAGAIGRSS